MTHPFAPGLLAGRVALVTGATSGLGRHFATVLAAAGATVAAAGRRRDALDGLAAEVAAAGGRCLGIAMEVTDPESVRTAFEEVEAQAGRAPDIVVNNAGITVTRPAMDLTPQEWSSVIDTNLTGCFTVAQAAARRMRAQGGGGSIVNIASILGRRVAGMVAPYAASKAGLIQLTKALALEWARDGIRVNALAPGYIETDLNRDFFAGEAGQRMVKRIPQRRLGRMADLDGPLLLLCSDASAYMTGSVLDVDGGHLLSTL
ncbi:SDR family oxidoreductase [Azospirillum sp. RWY-5-1]|uniref:SDR family oxidoreductase n=1 Tax=Azospirillum oleiclasticum TaxID=2735135 RepID=A0ABX2TIP1_9PROT|nr:SDR family oxidoreductase [Azospirillum oleiclasticum]NYZ16631.1 SDR family oxidoreductase [Azospirillum oleiclasticum]NYZ24118.1 SDR family oxidoreductase [Azospirillum oleiclasticum]